MDLRSRRRTLSGKSTASIGGLTAHELALALAELDAKLRGLIVGGLARPQLGDDLLIFMRSESVEARVAVALHLVPGRGRGRICGTSRRWPAKACATGPQIDRLHQLLVGKHYMGIHQATGEQRCQLQFGAAEERLNLELELFGNRGFWALTDSEGRMLVMSRLARRAGKSMAPGSLYAPPVRQGQQEPDLSSRFASPVLPAIDAAFTLADQAAEANQELDQLRSQLDKASKKLQAQITGLGQQRDAMQHAGDIRQQADLLLAYGFRADKSAGELVVEDPADPENEIRIALAPGRSIQQQADSLYKKARKYEDGLPLCEQRLAELIERSARLATTRSRLEQPEGLKTTETLQELEALGLRPVSSKRQHGDNKLRKITRGENFRRAISSEGYLILVGRNNRQNDKLSTSVSRGNDLWFHIGRGQAGSHVVLRLPKGKTASLDSLLDAASMAVHFSKSRGEPIAEVIYTQAKHVTKPKGLAPGKVLADHVKSLRVDLDSTRLQRLLDSADNAPPTS